MKIVNINKYPSNVLELFSNNLDKDILVDDVLNGVFTPLFGGGEGNVYYKIDKINCS